MSLDPPAANIPENAGVAKGRPELSGELNLGVFKTGISSTVVPAAGYSGIFHFPFRIYAREELQEHEGSTGSGARFRVHAPFLVRKRGAPLTDDVPFELWPNFRWHAAVPAEMRGDPDPPPELSYSLPNEGELLRYDGLRFDLWGSDAANQLSPFVLRALQWLRLESLQPWIGDIDRFHGSTMKRSFPIDEFGAAVHETPGLEQVNLLATRMHAVTNKMWKAAFDKAAAWLFPFFYNLFFDGANAAAAGDYQGAVVKLAMALEGGKDFFFSQIHPVRSRPGRAPRLKAPFDDTNVQRQLTKDSSRLFGRDMSLDLPGDWSNIERLYEVRGEVAHGKDAVYRTPKGPQKVTQEGFFPLQVSTWSAIRWVEDVAREQFSRKGRTQGS